MDGDAFKVMVRNHVVKLRGVKIGLLQTVFQTRHRHTCGGVRVHDAMGTGQAVVDGRMHRKAGRIDGVGRTIQGFAPEVNLDQAATARPPHAGARLGLVGGAVGGAYAYSVALQSDGKIVLAVNPITDS